MNERHARRNPITGQFPLDAEQRQDNLDDLNPPPIVGDLVRNAIRELTLRSLLGAPHMLGDGSESK